MVRFHTIPREEAGAYIFNPVERDAKRGLKRSWKEGPLNPDKRPEASGSQETPISSKGK